MTVSTDVPNDQELQRLIEQWRKGDRLAADVLFRHFWQVFPVVQARLAERFGICSDQTKEAMRWGFDAMIEELDLMLSGGALFFLDDEDPKTGKVRMVPLLTDRPRLGRRNDFRWKSAQSFYGWVKATWTRRTLDKLRTHKQRSSQQEYQEYVVMADADPQPAVPITQSPVGTTALEIKEELLRVRQELLRLIGRLQYEMSDEAKSETDKRLNKAKFHMSCALDGYLMQAMWNATRRSKFIWDRTQLTNNQQHELSCMMDVPVTTVVSDMDVCDLSIDATQARTFILAWTRARLAVEDPVQLGNMKKVRSDYLDMPVRRLRDELLQIVPWFFM